MVRWSCLVAAALIIALWLFDAVLPPSGAAMPADWDPATSPDPLRLLMLSTLLVGGGVLLAGARQRWLRRRRSPGVGAAARAARLAGALARGSHVTASKR